MADNRATRFRTGPPSRRAAPGGPGPAGPGRWRGSAERKPAAGRRRWRRNLLLAMLVAAAVTVPLVFRPVWPTTVVLVVENRSPDLLLADARWWRGATGPDGLVAQSVEPSGVDTLRVVHSAEFCVRVVDPETHAVSALLVDARATDATTRLVVGDGGRLEAEAPAQPGECPDALAAGPVRIEPGRYFVPGSSEGVQRERLLRRY